MNKKVAFVIAHEGYQPTEYKIPKKILENADINIITASDEPGVAVAKDESQTDVDITLQELIPEEYDSVIFIGGPGSMSLDGELAYYIIQRTYQLGKIVGAICLSTRILAASGILRDKKATGWNGDGLLPSIFQVYDVQFQHDQDVVIDGRIITASGPDVAQEFGEALLSLLKKEEYNA